MAPTARHEHMDEPAWPARAGSGCIVFLLDASSPLERRLLEQWVQRRKPEGLDDKEIRLLRIPASRRRGSGRIEPELGDVLESEQGASLCPLRIVWLPAVRDGVRAVHLSDLLTFGDPRDPGRLRQRSLLLRHPDRCRVVVGDPATVDELRARWMEAVGSAGFGIAGLAEFVVRQATLALERGERRLRGARYKVPRLVDQEILEKPAVRGGLARLARDLGKPEQSVMQMAAANLREIAATHSPFVIDIVAHLIRLLYTQGYGERLQYDREQLAGIASLSQRHPVVFLPTHKSNLDHLVLQYALHENGLPPNHTAGGINMNFFPVGPLVRRSGTFFIRRSFREDAVYKHVLQSYIDYLIEKRFSLEWYIEGGRSRSGKLLPPRFGMLAYVVDALRRGRSEDVYIIPVSIAYDQIQDVGSYVSEQRGGVKKKEGFGWFVGVVRSLRRRYGKIHIRFGEPLSLRSQLGAPQPRDDQGPDERELALQKLAFEVSVRINKATPITPTSLATLALLGLGERAVTVGEACAGLANLLRYVEERKLPTSTEFFDLASNEGVQRTLDALVENDVVTRFDGGLEPVYRIGPEQQHAAAYYRNTTIHFFVNAAIAEIAVLHVAEQEWEDPVEEFFAEAMRLRDLFKFEFFFADKEAFLDELRDELSFQTSDWEAKLSTDAASATELVRSFRPFTAHRILRPFLESYQVVSDQLERHEGGDVLDEGKFVATCLGLGKQYHLQHHIHSSASVSKILFHTALKLADNRGLVSGVAAGSNDEDMLEKRRKFSHEIRDAHRRVEAIVALAASRRARLIP